MTCGTYFGGKRSIPSFSQPELRLFRDEKIIYVLFHISKYILTKFNGTVKKTALYSVLGLREKRIYLTHGREKENNIKQCNCNCNCNDVSGNLVSSIYFRLL